LIVETESTLWVSAFDSEMPFFYQELSVFFHPQTVRG